MLLSYSPVCLLRDFILDKPLCARENDKTNFTAGREAGHHMQSETDAALHKLLSQLFQAHPWHGVMATTPSEQVYNAFIEIVPTDAVKYELDKQAGHLRLDRPQRFSSFSPTLYGFIPQTYCAEEVAKRCRDSVGIQDIKGDGDPLDICVLTEKSFAHGNFFVRARPIGGLRMIDGREADDKIIAVLENDIVYGNLRDVSECPRGLLERLQHYFLSYKQLPSDAPRRVEIAEIYDHREAYAVIASSMNDYRHHFGEPYDRLRELRRLLSEQ